MHFAFELGVEQRRLLFAHAFDDFERERHVRAFVTEDPVRACREPVQQTA
jgi:hypothetical protein